MQLLQAFKPAIPASGPPLAGRLNAVQSSASRHALEWQASMQCCHPCAAQHSQPMLVGPLKVLVQCQVQSLAGHRINNSRHPAEVTSSYGQYHEVKQAHPKRHSSMYPPNHCFILPLPCTGCIKRRHCIGVPCSHCMPAGPVMVPAHGLMRGSTGAALLKCCILPLHWAQHTSGLKRCSRPESTFPCAAGTAGSPAHMGRPDDGACPVPHQHIVTVVQAIADGEVLPLLRLLPSLKLLQQSEVAWHCRGRHRCSEGWGLHLQLQPHFTVRGQPALAAQAV